MSIMEVDGKQEQEFLAWMLGKGYVNLDQTYIKDIKELIWCTYRSGFEVIGGTAFTSDAGWGCMIRTGQMIVAESLKRLEHPVGDIVKLVQDDNNSPLSLHRIAVIGQELGKEIGQWHTPSITALSLHRLLTLQSIGLSSSMAQDLQLDKNEIGEKLRSGPCLVWLPMRLGINELNPIYKDLVKEILQCPLSVGIGGGRPRSSYYFFGYTGDDLFYLDPHITRPAVPSELDEEALATFMGDSAKRMPITAIDPCFVAAFLIKDLNDFVSFEAFIADLKDPSGCNLVSLGGPSKEVTITDCADGSDFVDIS